MLTRHISIPTHILAWLLALAGCLVAGACSSDSCEPERPGDESGEFVGTLSLYLSMGDSFSSSRSGASRTPGDGPYETDATPGVDSYHPGSDYENYIDINATDFRLYAFTGTNTTVDNTAAQNSFYEDITPRVTLHPIYDADGGISRHYYITFPVTKEFKEYFEANDLKLILLANWHGTYPAPVAGSPIKALVESTEAVMDYKTMTPAVTADNLIPLFGVKNFGRATSGMTSGVVKWLDDINLLRALAKVEVYDAESTAMPMISVQLTRYNTHFSKAPEGVTEESQYVTKSYYSDYGPGPTIPMPPVESGNTNYERSDRITLQTKVVDGKKHYIIYVPEYKNIGRGDKEHSQLVVNYSDGNFFTIDFKYYNEPPEKSGFKRGDYFNILRNYWYKFEIERGTSELNMVVDVVPYAEKYLNPSFGIDHNDGNP